MKLLLILFSAFSLSALIGQNVPSYNYISTGWSCYPEWFPDFSANASAGIGRKCTFGNHSALILEANGTYSKDWFNLLQLKTGYLYNFSNSPYQSGLFFSANGRFNLYRPSIELWNETFYKTAFVVPELTIGYEFSLGGKSHSRFHRIRD